MFLIPRRSLQSFLPSLQGDCEEPFLDLPALRSPEATPAGASGNRGKDFSEERKIGSAELFAGQTTTLAAVVQSSKPSIGNAIRGKY